MSSVLFSIKKKPEDTNYSHSSSAKHSKMVDATSSAIKELITELGSSLFDKEYGTTFIEDLGEQVNIYKIQYLVDNKYSYWKEKHGIKKVSISNVQISSIDGFLNISLKIHFNDGYIETETPIGYNGLFTTKTIIEEK